MLGQTKTGEQTSGETKPQSRQQEERESFEHLASNFEELARLVETLHSKAKKGNDSQDVHRLIGAVQQSAKVLQPLGELVLGKKQYGDFLREFRHKLKFTDQSNEYGDAYFWAGNDDDMASVVEKLREWDKRAKLLVTGQLAKTENNGGHLKKLKELADRARKAVLAFQPSEGGKINQQTRADIRTLVMCLRELGRDDTATEIESMFTEFAYAASFHLGGRDATAKDDLIQETLNETGQKKPDCAEMQELLGAKLYSVGLVLDSIERANGGTGGTSKPPEKAFGTRFREQPSHEAIPPKKRTVPSRRKSEKELENEKIQVQAALLTHHKIESDEINWEPASQKDLLSLLGADWNQSKISRALTRTFGPKPMTRYKRLCRTKAITGLLERLEDGSYKPEAGYYKPLHPTEKEDKRALND